MSSEKKIGILVLVALGVLIYFLVKMGSLSFMFEPKGYRVYAYFGSLAGLEERASVRLAGVKIGYVERIGLRGGRAEVIMKIFHKYRVAKGAKATVTSMGIMGEKYIEIFPGKGKGFIKEGEEIEGIAPLSIDQLGTMFYSIAQDVKSLSKTFKEVIGGKKGKASLDSILTNLDRSTSQLRSILSENKGKINESMGDLLTSIKDMKRAIRNFSEASEGISNIANEYKGKSVEIDNTARRLQKLSRKTEEVLSKADSLMEFLQEGKGSVGKALKDESLYENAKKIVRNTSKITEKLDRSLERLNFSINPYLYFSSEKLGKIGFKAQKGESFLRASIDVSKETNTYDLLFGRRYKWFSISSGVIEGKFGFSAGFHSYRGLFIRGEIYGPDSVNYRLLFGKSSGSLSLFGGYSREKKIIFGLFYGF